jgi:short chain dehydrogenase
MLSHACRVWPPTYKVFFSGASRTQLGSEAVGARDGHTWKDWTMSNPVVLITGALTGIGRATAIAFATEGACLAVAGRHDEAGQQLAAELRTLGATAEFIRADVRREDEVRQLVDRTVARFGRLDVAVNNAGTEGQVGPITEQTADSYAATFDTNVLGVILSMKHEVRVMQGQGSGSIINISSTYGHKGAAGASVYAASKHAVGGARDRQVGNPSERRGTRSHGHRHADSFYRHAGEEDGSDDGCSDGASGPLGGCGQSHRLPNVGRSFIHHRPYPQRRRRQDRWLMQSHATLRKDGGP